MVLGVERDGVDDSGKFVVLIRAIDGTEPDNFCTRYELFIDA